jgi:DNA-binding XRE family transcriptional regulator
VALCVVVPADRAKAVEQAIEEAAQGTYGFAEMFPDSTPGLILRGARGLREMTQAQLGGLIGVSAANISDMERGRRPIGKAMAKRLGQALDYPWKALL